MNKSTLILEKFKKLPFGLWLFSRALCFKAPYFGSIRPTFTLLNPGAGEAIIKRRRAILNHLGTVHAIAMANLCEWVGGTTLEMTIPNTHRWIPKSMKINYLVKAESDIRAKTSISVDSWPDAGTIPVFVKCTDSSGKEVVTAEIEMYVTRKK